MKKTCSPYLLLLALAGTLASCAKTDIRSQGTASLTIINAVVGGDTLIPNFSGSYNMPGSYNQANFLIYDQYSGLSSFSTNGNQFNAFTGAQQLAVYQYPDTLPSSKPLITMALNLPPGSIQTLFLTGTVQVPDTLLTIDHLPVYPATDTATGIRFVNLSPGSTPISINLQGQSGGSEAASLPYKSVTSFKQYPATSDISSYTFEFREAATGNLLTTFLATGINNNGSDPSNPVNTWQFKNSTLAFLGLPNGSGATAQTVLLINHF